MTVQDENVTIIEAGERFLVEDRDSGSKGIMPILVDAGYKIEVIKVDKGILQNERDRERACDYMLVANGDTDDENSTSGGLNRVICMTELKGTGKENEINHAYSQVSQSIDRIPAEYMKSTDYMMAAIAGAQDKTLPSMINPEKKKLCEKMYSKSRHKVNDMNKLVFYIQPNVRIRKAFVNTSKNPRVIECYSRKGAEIPVPSMLVDVIK